MSRQDEFDQKTLSMLWGLASQCPPVSRAQVAAAITYRKRLIAVACNSRKSHPFQQKYADRPTRIYFHAEIAVIKQALYAGIDLGKSTLYICRYKKKSWGMSKPCEGCHSAIISFGIPRVLYSLDTTDEYTELSI